MKKSVALLLALVMCLSMLNLAVFAADDDLGEDPIPDVITEMDSEPNEDAGENEPEQPEEGELEEIGEPVETGAPAEDETQEESGEPVDDQQEAEPTQEPEAEREDETVSAPETAVDPTKTEGSEPLSIANMTAFAADEEMTPEEYDVSIIVPNEWEKLNPRTISLGQYYTEITYLGTDEVIENMSHAFLVEPEVMGAFYMGESAKEPFVFKVVNSNGSGIPAGRYLVVITIQPSVYLGPSDLYPNGGQYPTTETTYQAIIEVDADHTEFVMDGSSAPEQPAANQHFNIVDQYGNPISIDPVKSVLQVRDQATNNLTVAKLDDQGCFYLENPAPGTYSFVYYGPSNITGWLYYGALSLTRITVVERTYTIQASLNSAGLKLEDFTVPEGQKIEPELECSYFITSGINMNSLYVEWTSSDNETLTQLNGPSNAFEGVREGTATVTATVYAVTGDAPVEIASVSCEATVTPRAVEANVTFPAMEDIHVALGTELANLPLPSIVTGSINGSESTVEVPVTWTCDNYDGNTPATYIFTGTVAMPEGTNYTVDNNPTVNVIVENDADLNEKTCTINENWILYGRVYVFSPEGKVMPSRILLDQANAREPETVMWKPGTNFTQIIEDPYVILGSTTRVTDILGQRIDSPVPGGILNSYSLDIPENASKVDISFNYGTWVNYIQEYSQFNDGDGYYFRTSENSQNVDHDTHVLESDGEDVSIAPSAYDSYNYTGYRIGVFHLNNASILSPDQYASYGITVSDGDVVHVEANTETMVDASQQVFVIYLFDRHPDTVSITVNYVDADGTPIREPELIPNKAYGEAYTIDTPEIDGYTFDHADRALEGVATEDIVITLVYTPEPTYTVTYTDGVDDEEVFEDQSTSGLLIGDPTPAFGEVPTREGYIFAGWAPEVEDTVTGNAIYEAQWERIYTVTYTDGVNDEEVFADQVYSGLHEGDATPEFDGTPTREGYTFTGWAPEVADTVTGDAVYVAQWAEDEPDTPYIPPVVVSYNVTVNYVDTEGNTINPSYTNVVTYGSTFAADVRSIEGYTFDHAEPSATVTVTGNTTITLVYSVVQDVPEDEPPLSEDPGEDPGDEPPVEIPDEEPPLSEDPGDEPPVEIPDEEPPLSQDPGDEPPVEIPDEEPPLSQDPSEEPPVEIPDEEPPLVNTPPQDDTPQTGDNQTAILWTVALLASGAALAAMLVLKRKETN